MIDKFLCVFMLHSVYTLLTPERLLESSNCANIASLGVDL